jgi:hypothetical protein
VKNMYKERVCIQVNMKFLAFYNSLKPAMILTLGVLYCDFVTEACFIIVLKSFPMQYKFVYCIYVKLCFKLLSFSTIFIPSFS